MKLRGRLPPEFKDIWAGKGVVYLLAPDTVMRAELSEPGSFKELMRWTGASLETVTARDNRVVVGTDKGAIIIENGEIKPVWVGSTSLVLLGNFSKRHKMMILAEKSERGIATPNLFVPFMVPEEEIRKSKKAVSKGFGELTMFPAAICPFRQDLMKMAKLLIKNVDVDEDGFDEVVAAAYEENRAQITIVKTKEGMPDILTFPVMPTFSIYPIAMDVGDIDGDGLAEPIILLRDRYDFRKLYILTFTFERRKEDAILEPVLVGEFDIRKLFSEEDFPDDAEIYIFGGEFDGDGLPEILVVGYIPPGFIGRRGSLISVKVDIRGNISRLNKVAVPPLRFITKADVDGDGLFELVALTFSGYLIIDVESKGFKESLRVSFPSKIVALTEKKSDSDIFIIAGPVFAARRKFIIAELGPNLLKRLDEAWVKTLRIGEGAFALLGSNDIILLVREGNVQKAKIKGARDLAFLQDVLYVLADGVYRVSNDVEKVSNTSGDSLIIIQDEIAVLRGHEILSFDGKKLGEVLPGTRICGKRLCLRIRGHVAEILDFSGAIVDSVEGFSLNRITPIRLKGKFGVLGISERGELYFFDLEEDDVLRSELTNIVGMCPFEDRVLLSFENNWIVEYSVREVFPNESS